MLRVSPSFLLEKFTQTSVQDVLRRIKSGDRRITVPVPPGAVRTRIAAGIIRDLHARTVIVSGNLAAQAVWFDRYGDETGYFHQAMDSVWGAGSLPAISALPYSCSPVLLLNADKHLPDTEDPETAQHTRERLSRHMVKHHYRLVFIDSGVRISAQWRSVIHFLKASADVVEITFPPDAAETPGAAHRPELSTVVSLMHKTGEYLPVRHLAQFVGVDDAADSELLYLYREMESLLHTLQEPVEGVTAFKEWMEQQDRGDTGDEARESIPPPRGAAASIPTRSTVMPVSQDSIAFMHALASYRDDYLRSTSASAGHDAIKVIDQFFSFTLRNRPGARFSVDAMAQFGVSKEKLAKIGEILEHESAILKDDLRALVILTEPSPEHASLPEGAYLLRVLDAVATARTATPTRPALLTGSSILCPPDASGSIITEARALVAQRGWEIQFTLARHETHDEIDGFGKDWNSRTYCITVQSLMSMGWIRCAIGLAGLLASGWDTLPVNTVIDLQVREDILLFNRQSAPHGIMRDLPWKLVQYWNIIACSGVPVIGALELHAYLRLHDGWFGPASDAALVTGMPQVRTLLARGIDAADPAARNDINAAILELSSRREAALKAWKVGEDLAGVRFPCIELHPAAGHPESLPIPARQETELAEEMKAFAARMQSTRFQTTFFGVLTLAVIIAAALLLPTEIGGIASVAIALGYLVSTGARLVKLRYARPELSSSSIEELIARSAAAVADALDADGKGGADRVRLTCMPDASYRIHLETPDEGMARDFAVAVAGLFHDGGPDGTALIVNALRLHKARYRDLLHDAGADRLYAPSFLLSMPACIAGDAERGERFIHAWRKHVGHSVVTRVRDIPEPPAVTGPAIIGVIVRAFVLD